MSSSGKVVISNEQQYRIDDLVAHGAFSEVYKCHKLINSHNHHIHHHHHHHHNHNQQQEEENHHCKREEQEEEEEELQPEHCGNTHDNTNINVEDNDNKESSVTYAIKIVNKDLAVEHHMEEALIREVNAMEAVGYSPYVVHLIDRFISSSNYYIVMNYMEGGTLLEFIRAHRHHIDWTQATATNDGNHWTPAESQSKCTTKSKQTCGKETTNAAPYSSSSSSLSSASKEVAETTFSLSSSSSSLSSELPFMWQVAPYFLKQLLLGLQHLHAHNVVHRDIKPENLLLGNDASTLMISDFGFACYAPPNRTLHRTCGTLKYCAPELLVKKPRYDGRKVDIWAAGVTLYVMLCFKHPFKPTRNDADALLECILESSTSSLMLPETLPNAARDVLHMMLATDPQQRASIEELLAHPWLEQIELKGRYDPSGVIKHTAMKRKNDNEDSVEPSTTKKRRTSYVKCNAQTQVNTLPNEMKINDGKLTHSSETVPLATETKKNITELCNTNDIINNDGGESHDNGNYCVNQCDTTTTHRVNNINCNSSDSENDKSYYSEECTSPDSMVSTDNGFYCSLHLSRVNTSDDMSGNDIAKLQSDYVEYTINSLTQSSLEEEDSPQLTFLTPVSSNNEMTSHFVEHVTAGCNSYNVADFAGTTPFLLHTAVNQDMSECHGYDAGKHIGTNAHVHNKHEDNWRSVKHKRQTNALPLSPEPPPQRSMTMIHGMFYIFLLLLYIQLFFLIFCITVTIESCFNVRLSELQRPYWLRDLLRYCTVPPLDRLNMWMSSSSLPLHVSNSHEWRVRQHRIHKNKKENSYFDDNKIDAGKDDAMQIAYNNNNHKSMYKDKANASKTSMANKLKEKVSNLFRCMKTNSTRQCLQSNLCKHVNENDHVCTSRNSNVKMPSCHNSFFNASAIRDKLENSFCKRETGKHSERNREELCSCCNNLDCNNSTCTPNQNAKPQDGKIKISITENEIEEKKYNAVAKCKTKGEIKIDTTNTIKLSNNDSIDCNKSCQQNTNETNTLNNNYVSTDSINASGVYSPTFPFPPHPLSFNSSVIGQEDFPLSNASIH